VEPPLGSPRSSRVPYAVRPRVGNPVSPSVYELYSLQALSDPKGTTNSEEHSEAMKRHRLDRHTASAYMIAVKRLKQT